VYDADDVDVADDVDNVVVVDDMMIFFYDNDNIFL